ncbi:MAG: hypothetical protein QOF51_533 [Chloroflexota bacterium]|jgi:SAM-dependent methyltransferase|nr:hypothetical protein [Chloroflexota bacterium]
MDRYLEANRARWDELVSVHAGSAFYDVASFKAGGIKLHDLEREELGDVAGKSLLHLQCHFGMDTLSWARLGATVTGVDFSEEAIGLARSLAAECAILATFICANLYDVPAVVHDQFDVVFASYGVLWWLPDLTRWAEIIAACLKPGGIFYIAEHHPLIHMLDDESTDVIPPMKGSYFASGPLELPASGDYADWDAVIQHDTEYGWQHPIGEIISTLASAGLRIDFLHEFPYCTYQRLPTMERGADRNWRLNPAAPTLPLLFSLKATKP